MVLSTLLRHGQKGAYVCLLWNMEYLHGPRPSGRMVIVLKSSFSSHDNRESIDAWRTLCYTQTYTHNCKNRSLKPLRMLIVSSSQSSYNPYEPGISPCLHFKLSKDPSFRPLSLFGAKRAFGSWKRGRPLFDIFLLLGKKSFSYQKPKEQR